MELNREQVIKALECCTKPNCVGFECPLYGDQAACVTGLNIAALSLIKELTEENEKLLNEFKSMPLGKFEFELLYKEKCKQLDNANSFIVELLADKEFSKINRTEYKKMVVSEMKERLTTFFNNDDNLKYNEVDAAYINEMIDQIAKEMEEGV